MCLSLLLHSFESLDCLQPMHDLDQISFELQLKNSENEEEGTTSERVKKYSVIDIMRAHHSRSALEKRQCLGICEGTPITNHVTSNFPICGLLKSYPW